MQHHVNNVQNVKNKQFSHFPHYYPQHIISCTFQQNTDEKQNNPLIPDERK